MCGFGRRRREGRQKDSRASAVLWIQLVKYMITDKLISQWGVWFIYQGDSYEGNVNLITTLSSVADLAYFWLHSPIAHLSNFFLN